MAPPDTDQLRDHYRDLDSGWSCDDRVPMPPGASTPLAEDAAYGLRWTEIVGGITIDPLRSLVGAVPMNPT
jgi:hypothetical protein